MMGNAKEEGSDAHNNNNNTYENRNNLTIMTENDNIPTNERGESSTNSAESIKMNNTMTSSVGSLPNLNMNSKYDDYDEAQLEEFAQIASPKVSELLKEQALALDDLLGSAWMNNSSGSSSSDDSDAQLRRAKRKERRRRGHGNEHKNKQPHNKRHNDSEEEEDEDGMNEECKRLTAAEMELRNELELATNGFASLMNFDNNFYAEDDFDGAGNVDDDEDYYDGTIDFDKDGGINKDGGEVKQSATTGQHNMISQTVQPPLSKNTAMAKVDGGDSDIGPSDPQVRQQHHQTRKSNDTNSYAQGSPSNAKMSYSLADHALTLDVSRSAAGMYTRPLLSRHDLETLGIVTLPSWIVRPGGEGDSNDASSPINSPSNSRGYIENTSRGRENYMKRVLSCTAEYVEPPKSKTLRKLFSGWNPGPGERRTEDISNGGDRGRGGEGGGVGGSGDDPQRVMAYSPSPQHVDGDSSVEENDDNDSENFVDVEGVSYPTSPPVHRIREPRPVRVVTIRIRPDVLCGATMDALTMTVERLGGEMTKRQGGHMRAILPGIRKRIWMPGEWEREREYKSPSTSNDACLNGNGNNYLDSGESQSGNNEYVMVNDDNEDASSVASGLSSFLSLASPIKMRSNRSKQPKGPRYVTLPPYLVDAQLVTKKLGKECQRVLLLRIYRIQDIACMGSVGGEEEEVLDVPAPLNKEDFGGGSTANGTSLNNDNNGNNSIGGDQGKRIDSELESECSLKALREAAALVQRIKVVGADGFAVDLPSPMIDTLENTRESMSTISQSNQSTETKSYFKSFSDALVSPVKYFSGNESTSQMDEAMQSPGVPQRHIHTPNTSKRRPPTAMELMSDELMQKYYPSPSVGTRPSSKLAVAKKKSHGIFPSLSKEDSPYVKSSWLFLRECIDEMDRRNLAYR